MNKMPLRPLAALIASAAFSLAFAQTGAAKLSGDQEVPPATTQATGAANIAVSPDHSVSGTVSYTGITPTMAHIHEAAMGKNGPVVIPLVKSGEGSFAVPPNAKLSDAQYASYQAGNLYVNVHSAAYPGGEIRAQLMPAKPTAAMQKPMGGY